MENISKLRKEAPWSFLGELRMAKKLTLNQTWTLCLRMWRWIASEWKKLKRKPSDVEGWVERKKEKWLTENGFASIESDCFFCEATCGDGTCGGCPGKLVDPDFSCYGAGWASDPPAFYKELLHLNRIRNAPKRKDKK